jgi:hypothetical protein
MDGPRILGACQTSGLETPFLKKSLSEARG